MSSTLTTSLESAKQIIHKHFTTHHSCMVGYVTNKDLNLKERHSLSYVPQAPSILTAEINTNKLTAKRPAKGREYNHEIHLH